MNNIVHLHTYIDGNVGGIADINSAIFVQLTVNGFQDANGNPITATLLPEPGTLGTFGLALLVGLVAMRAQQKRSAEPMVRIRRLEPMSIFVVDSGK